MSCDCHVMITCLHDPEKDAGLSDGIAIVCVFIQAVTGQPSCTGENMASSKALFVSSHELAELMRLRISLSLDDDRVASSPS